MTGMSGPTRLATELETRIAELEMQRDNAETRRERRGFNQLLYRNRELLRWCKTRVGYQAEHHAGLSLEAKNGGAAHES